MFQVTLFCCYRVRWHAGEKIQRQIQVFKFLKYYAISLVSITHPDQLIDKFPFLKISQSTAFSVRKIYYVLC